MISEAPRLPPCWRRRRTPPKRLTGNPPRWPCAPISARASPGGEISLPRAMSHAPGARRARPRWNPPPVAPPISDWRRQLIAALLGNRSASTPALTFAPGASAVPSLAG
eukprot:6760704-Pyramimonas_sp.AAC.1